MPPSESRDRRGLAAGAALTALSALLFSSKAVIVKLAYPLGIDVMTLLALRMGFSLPAFLAIAWCAGRSAPPLARRDRALAMGLGVLGYYVASLLDFEGLRYIGVGLERMVLYTYPSLVVVLGAAFARRRLTRLAVVALIATYAGVCLTYAGQPTDVGAGTMTGVALVAGSALASALFVLASDGLMRRIGATRFMGVAMSSACLAVLTHAAVARLCGGGCGATDIPLAVYGYGAILATAGTIAPSLLMSQGMRRVGPQRFAIISAIGPVGTVVLGWLMLDEAITALNAVGMALTVAAGAMMGVAKPRPALAQPMQNRSA